MGAAPLAAAWCWALAAAAEGAYVRKETHVGADFISHWTFWDEPDPTHGFVDYVDHATAGEAGLVQVADGHVYLGADMQNKVEANQEGRKSVRIQTKAVYNEGLFVFTADHIPTGCGAWPAFWMYGEDSQHAWPRWGEIDIIEAVHTDTRVKTTLHTRKHCDQAGVHEGQHFTSSWASGAGNNIANNCFIGAEGQYFNQGCSQEGPQGTVGAAFNNGGGGTFTTEWDPAARHIRTWFWPAGTEPADLQAGRPDPESWGLPYSFFSLDPDTCSKGHFKNMRLVFDLTFCGDWADPTFAGACPQHNMTCREFVGSHPKAMSEAYWSIRELSVYTKQERASAHEATAEPTSSPTSVATPQPTEEPTEEPTPPAPPSVVVVEPAFGSSGAPSSTSAEALVSTMSSSTSRPSTARVTTTTALPTSLSSSTSTSSPTHAPSVSVILRDTDTPSTPSDEKPPSSPDQRIPIALGHADSGSGGHSPIITTVIVSVVLVLVVAMSATAYVWKVRRGLPQGEKLPMSPFSCFEESSDEGSSSDSDGEDREAAPTRRATREPPPQPPPQPPAAPAACPPEAAAPQAAAQSFSAAAPRSGISAAGRHDAGRESYRADRPSDLGRSVSRGAGIGEAPASPWHGAGAPATVGHLPAPPPSPYMRGAWDLRLPSAFAPPPPAAPPWTEPNLRAAYPQSSEPYNPRHGAAAFPPL